jgi:hypothetical protein
MDEQGDYHIKVLIMAPLIMVSLPTVFLLLHERVPPSRRLISLQRYSSSLSILWMASWCEWLSLLSNGGAPAFRVQDPSGARKTGTNWPPKWAGPASLG